MMVAINRLNQTYFFLAVILYSCIYMAFLYGSDFLPYVFDNNETYSSLGHAYNMYYGDWLKNFGLADEAFIANPDAHPVLHTHQGNWPRIYAYILFALGARSAESQILIHVFTIGLISICLIYRYFKLISNANLAFIICIVFMTDYILFAQWQIVTYRIWHCFFVFSSLNCMHGLEGKEFKWKILTIANYMALFYWELVFAAYVSLWSITYYSLLVKFNWKKIFKCMLIIGLSGLTSLCILFTQLTLFMGAKNALRDFQLTFFGRNFTNDPETFKKILIEFYHGKGIAFFYNMQDGSAYNTLKEFAKGLTIYGFQVHGPTFSLISIIGALALIINSLCSFIRVKMKSLSIYKIELDVILKSFGFSTLLFIVILWRDQSFLGLKEQLNCTTIKYFISLFYLCLFGLLILICLFNKIQISQFRVSAVNSVLACLFPVFCGLLIIVQPEIYEQTQSDIWYNDLTSNVHALIWQLSLICIVILGGLYILFNPFNARDENRLIFYYLSAAVLAYSIVYMVFPGYMYTGYLRRYAPIIVFFIDFIIGLTFYKLIRCINSIYSFKKVNNVNIFRSGFNLANISYNLDLSAILLLTLIPGILMTYQWIYQQFKYFEIFPPDSFSFIKILRQKDFINKTFVSNQYSMPFAYESKGWAYITHSKWDYVRSENGFEIPLNYEYLWFKNKYDYVSYSRPDYFVCFLPNSFNTYNDEKHGELIYNNSCHVRNTNYNNLSFPKHVEILADNQRKGRWSITKLDWNFPPFLAKNKKSNNVFDTVYHKDSGLLEIKYSFKQQDSQTENITRFKITAYDQDNKLVYKSLNSAQSGMLRIMIPKGLNGRIEIAGAPMTKFKTGPEEVVVQIL